MIPEEVFEQSLLTLFATIRPFLEDDTVTEVMINGPGAIFIERRGKLIKTDARFPTPKALFSALRNAAQYVGKHVDEERPILEGRLPDGSRVAAAHDIAPHLQAALDDWQRAEPELCRRFEALALRRQAEGPMSPSVADDLNALGEIEYAAGDLASAENSYRQVMEIDKVVFDRNGYLYHGRVKALAEAAREAGLKF